MQVSEQKDHITHAVIGGGETIDFGISSSAEFFNILSSTLYKDQILAVVREVLCNAWDAHIEAGCTKVPVQLTLADGELIVKDFGKGIHHDDMGLIYGTYGNSTKKNDGNQTGGFGLGCKAPFAYTDHFEVQSSHAGVRTIYNLSKSSAQAMGKPGIVPITSFPTTDTGLQVKIPIKSNIDMARFERLIHRIVFNGDMNMTLNGIKLDTIEFDTSKANVLLVYEKQLIDNQDSIMVRYGNVIYPVDCVPEIEKNYVKISAHLRSLAPHLMHRFYAVFQAPPHSIAVTPSRETLSMQGHTIATLKKLFSSFIEMLETKFIAECDKHFQEAVDDAVSKKKIGVLLHSQAAMPPQDSWKRPIANLTIDSLADMAKMFLMHNYPKGSAFRKNDVKQRLNKLVAAKLVDRGQCQTYLRYLDNANENNCSGSDWLHRHVTKRIINKLLQANVPVSGLHVYDNEATVPNHYYRIKHSSPLVPVCKAGGLSIYNALPYLRNIVVVTHSLAEFETRVRKHPDFDNMKSVFGLYVYRTGLKKNERANAVELFKKMGMHVIDLTYKQAWELEQALEVTAKPRKKPKKGIVKLSAVNTRLNCIDTSKMASEDAERITDPVAVVEVSLRSGVNTRLLPISNDQLATKYLVELYGDKVGITNNNSIYEKWIKKGAKIFDKYVIEAVADYMLNSPTIKEYWAFNPKRVMLLPRMINHAELLNAIYSSPALRAEFGLVNNLTATDEKYLYIFQNLLDQTRFKYHTDNAVCKANDTLKDIPMDKANYALAKRIADSEMVDLINVSSMASLLRNSSSNAPTVQRIISLVHSILS